jgi:oxygen-dependent protoporphyrinogen oxidase
VSAKRRVLVIGGGLSGLATAQALVAGGAEVAVVEAADRPGGKALTLREEGWTVEQGPNGFLDSVPRTLELAEELGLKERIQPADESAARRFLWLRGRLREIPTSPPAFLRSDLLSLRGRLRVLGEPLARRRPEGDESVAAFARRRIGAEAARSLVSPMVLGVFAGDAERLSLRSVFPRMWEMESEHGSLFRALLARRRARRGDRGGPSGPGGHLTSFRSGVQELVGALADALGERLSCGGSVERLRRVEEGWRVAVRGEGEERPAEAVVLACEAFASARLLESLDAALAAELLRIAYAPVAVLGLAYEGEQLSEVPAGFGFLAPRGEGLRILGCLWDSSIFPGRAPEGKVLLRVMLGGAVDPEAARLEEEEMVSLVREELRRSMGIEARPVRTFLKRWERGIPQYEKGHQARLEAIEGRRALHPGLHLTGNAYRGVALNSCVTEADRVAAEVLEGLARAT